MLLYINFFCEGFLVNGFKVTKIHKALQFNEKPYMRMLINGLDSKQWEVKTKVEKIIFQLIWNSPFGKMCNSKLNKSRCNDVNDPKECAQIISHPNFTSFTIIDSIIGLLHWKNKLNKNTAAGNAILEISKKLILEFNYNVSKLQWPEEGQARVYYRDTDSFVLKVKTDNLLENLENAP